MNNAFLNCYDTMAKEGLATTEVGAHALQKAASGMKRYLRNWKRSGEWGDKDELMDALHRNQQLWTILQVECSSPNSSIDSALRGNLLQLSCFVDKSTFQFIATTDPKKLEMLVQINESLVEGLTAQASPAALHSEESQAMAVSLSF